MNKDTDVKTAIRNGLVDVARKALEIYNYLEEKPERWGGILAEANRKAFLEALHDASESTSHFEYMLTALERIGKRLDEAKERFEKERGINGELRQDDVEGDFTYEYEE